MFEHIITPHLIRTKSAPIGLVCVVEDDPDQARLLELSLMRAGFTVRVFSDLHVFHQQMQEANLCPLAVIMDIMFPEGALAGVQLIQKLQQDAAFQVPVIFISSRNDLQARLAVLRAGGHAYLTKPLDLNHLVFRLYELLESHDPWRILLVDDEPANLKLLRKMLAGQGYNHLVEIQDPREVLAVYQQQRPDLILLDINMPHLDGYAVMDQLKALQDSLMPPILVLTAQHQREYMLLALDGGARDFLSKPFDRNELLMRVRNLLEVQLAHRMMHDQNALLEQKVAERTRELDSTRLQVIRRLGRAAEFRDNETGLHVVRMSKFAVILARSLGWSDEECELLLHASPMHDLGKIGIPDHILLKPGKLTADEYSVMQEHAQIGATLLEGDDSPLFTLAREIAENHHEKWDGSGYPKGLAGEAIPLSGRITALADVFDALTSSRPYKKAWAIEDALSFIKDQSGRHFDPVLVEHFERCLPEILAVRQAYLDESVEDSATYG